MAHLIDTTVLIRLANATDAQHAVAARAVLELHRRGEVLHVTPQVMVEFRNVATRPTAVNGLGLSIADAEAQAATFEARFPLLAETPDIYPAWKALVGALGVIGKQVHENFSLPAISICESSPYRRPELPTLSQMFLNGCYYPHDKQFSSGSGNIKIGAKMLKSTFACGVEERMGLKWPFR